MVYAAHGAQFPRGSVYYGLALRATEGNSAKRLYAARVITRVVNPNDIPRGNYSKEELAN